MLSIYLFQCATCFVMVSNMASSRDICLPALGLMVIPWLLHLFVYKFFSLQIICRDFEILGWCSWGEGVSVALVGHPSSDDVTIKMPYGVDVLHRPASHPIFSYWVG